MIRPNARLWLVAVFCLFLGGCDDTYVPPEQPAKQVTLPPPPAGAPAPPPPAVSRSEPAAPASQPDATPGSEPTESTPDAPEPVQEPAAVAPPEAAARPLTVDEARAKIEELGGRVADDQSGHPVSVFLNRTSINDQQVSVIQYLPGIEVLNLTGTPVGDEGLKHVHGLTGLKRIYAAYTNITDEGVRQLNQALPDCQVYR